MPARRLFTVLAVLLALVTFAAACGSDSDDSSSDDGDAAAAEDAGADSDAEEAAADEEPAAEEDEAASDEVAPADEGDAAEEPEEAPEVDTEGEGSDPSLCPVAALEAADGPVEIEFWHAMSDVNLETLEAMVGDYNAAQDKVKVTTIAQGTYNDTLSKYLAALRGGDLPDIVQMEETVMQIMVDSQSTVPVGSCIAADDYDTSDFVEPLFGQYSINGELKTMPFQLSNPVFYYNKLKFEEAGLDVETPPTNFDELLEASRVLVDSGTVPNAFALEVEAWYPEQWSSMAGEALVDNANGRVDDRARAAELDNSSITESFEWIDTMNKEGLVLNVGENPTNADHLLAIAQDNAAMTIGTSAALGTIYDVISQFPNVDIGVAPMPGPTDGTGGVTVGGGSLYMMSETDDEVKAAVWDLMKWLNEPEQQSRWHVSTGYIPTRISSTDDPAVQELWAERPGFKVAYDQLATSVPPPGGGGPVIGAYVEFRDAIEKAIERILNGTDVPGAQTDAQSEATDAIVDYNDRVGA